MKKESSLLKNLGKMFEIFRKLVNAVLYRGGNDEHILRILSDDSLSEGIAGLLIGTHEIVPIQHTIDLGADPKLPFTGAKVEKHEGEGLVKIELRSDDNLYIGGQRIDLFLSKKQINGNVIEGHELRKELENGKKVLLNSNVLDYLCDNSELWPEHWKKDEKGNTIYIYFWGSVFFSPAHGSLYVRYACWTDGRPFQGCEWLVGGWLWNGPAARLAS